MPRARFSQSVCDDADELVYRYIRRFWKPHFVVWTYGQYKGKLDRLIEKVSARWELHHTQYWALRRRVLVGMPPWWFVNGRCYELTRAQQRAVEDLYKLVPDKRRRKQ